jgi:hypothetical protein
VDGWSDLEVFVKIGLISVGLELDGDKFWVAVGVGQWRPGGFPDRVADGFMMEEFKIFIYIWEVLIDI